MKTKSEKQPDIDAIRHSLAHLLAAAVQKKFPKVKLGIGPTIEHGFYYDFQVPRSFTPEDLKEFEKTMRELIKKELPFTGEKVTATKARAAFKGQPFKLDLVKEFAKGKKELTIYRTGDVFTDLCRGGHVKNTKEIDPDAFALDKIAGAYWRGDEKNPQLQRIYGFAFHTKGDLQQHLAFLEEARKRDHKKLGPQLDLFTFSDLVGGGLPLWTPKGTMLYDLLDNFVWELRKKRGYQKVEIPHITKKDLYETSGHWDKFKDELFKITTREGHLFAMKPMNCPHHTQIYARRQWSYRELPQRYANTTTCYRDEQSGELAGLSRVRSITQDDAHVFCRMSQAGEEIKKVWDIIQEFYSVFGFPLRLRLSLHDPKQPEKYLGKPEAWKKAENALRDVVKERKAHAEEALGEAAFYGPKLDFMADDSLGREWQVATIQLDVNMPERFDLFCINEKGDRERIVMIHAAIMGSIERFLSVLIEHFAGAFPVWLAPVQTAVLPVSEKNREYAKKVHGLLSERGVRSELRDSGETLGKRIRESELEKVPYAIVVGEKEEKNGSINVRSFKKKAEREYPISEFLEKIEKKIKERAL